MINLAINSSIIKSSVSISRKSEPASAETQKKTFQNVLSETIHKKNTLNETPYLYSTNYIFNEADTANEITNYTEIEIDEETLNEVTRYEEPEQKPQVKILNDGVSYAEYIDIEINGIWVKQVTDEFLTSLGYNVEMLKANDLNEDLLKYIDANGFVPKYVIPLDMGWGTDYTKTLATTENLAKTVENNASFGFYGGTLRTADMINNNISPNNANKPLGNTENITETTEDNVAVDFGASKNVTAVINKYSQNNAHNTSENLVKPAGENAALRILSNLNILNIWDPKEKKDEKK